ncbi:unnamed protein product [Brassica rapa]|uniref:Sm domain-containing protein n=3 Tax=Brassica TaxID=3705 RepID=A0A3P5ZH62_BRACM|nr:unnamed protein product [Brassica napus]CAG7890267.1 unnamed protein product [Brassica rapa]VDC77499.1 unnamed protein product [Brassica rapa]
MSLLAPDLYSILRDPSFLRVIGVDVVIQMVDLGFEAGMNMQPGLPSKASTNGSPYIRGGEREGVLNKAKSIKSHPANAASNGEAGSLKGDSRDGLVYLTTCKIGHLVEVHLKNGSVYSGIFHAADVEKDFGIILKMASLIKDGGLRGHKARSEFVRKPPSKTFIIPADELVQVIAKDLSISSDGMSNAVQSEKSGELLTDSSISKSFHTDQGRELKPWIPDGDVPQGLDNVFDDPWKRGRGWDQFKVNESLFGVKSTFDEEIYTTKLDRGIRTREMEERAQRIAREIEGENTRDLHVAEERGFQLNEKFDIDEESKYSAVLPADAFDDSGFDEEDDELLDTCNDETFGGSSTSTVQKPVSSSGKGYGELRDASQPSRNNTNVDQMCSISDDHAQHLPSEQRSKDFTAPGSSISESQMGERRNKNNPEFSHSNRSAEESVSGHGDSKEGAKLGGGGTSAWKTVAEKERQVSEVSGKPKSESFTGQSASRRSSESRPGPSTSSRPGLSPSSSIGSLSSSEKSTLNPNAKEFKLNPNAKSFKPTAAARPQSPMADASFYYPAAPAPVQQMPGMPLGYGIQPQYPGQQQMIYYPGHQHPQAFYPPNAQPQFPQQQQQMMMGRQPRPQMVYMPPPPYQPDNPYNQGRE